MVLFCCNTAHQQPGILGCSDFFVTGALGHNDTHRTACQKHAIAISGFVLS